MSSSLVYCAVEGWLVLELFKVLSKVVLCALGEYLFAEFDDLMCMATVYSTLAQHGQWCGSSSKKNVRVKVDAK